MNFEKSGSSEYAGAFPSHGKLSLSLRVRAWGNDNPDKLLNASNLSGGISRNNIPYLKPTNAEVTDSPVPCIPGVLTASCLPPFPPSFAHVEDVEFGSTTIHRILIAFP